MPYGKNIRVSGHRPSQYYGLKILFIDELVKKSRPCHHLYFGYYTQFCPLTLNYRSHGFSHLTALASGYNYPQLFAVL
jgi:hypothetical protein